jgi:hypothetical protein
MISASLFVIGCTVRNRILRRLRRLREPRYLLGAIVGAGYLYFSVIARMWGAGGRRARRGRPATDEDLTLPALLALGPPIGGLTLFAVTVVCWLLPVDASLLDFSDAEVQFLFPAPLTRRQLIIHRLLRSQLGLLFASLAPALLYPSASIGMRLRTAVAMWVLLVTGKVYFTGVTIARGHVRSADYAARRTARLPLLVVAAAAAVVFGSVMRAFVAQAGTGSDVITRLVEAMTSGAVRIVLSPFVALARPLFTASFASFVVAMVPAIAVLAATVWWVLYSDETFQADVTELAARQQESRTAPGPAIHTRASNWRLAAAGPTETLFFWKNGMQALRRANSLTLLRVGVPMLFLVVALTSLRLSARDAQGPAALLGMFALFAAAFAAFLGPQIVRTDLRSDLEHLELLRTWPVKPASVVRGEMLWPGSVVTATAWFALTCAVSFSAAAFPAWPLMWRSSSALAAFLLAPAVVFGQYTVHAAATVLFPAWVPLGDQRPRGLDAMGQRLILFGGVLLSLVVVVGPGAIAGGLVWVLLYGLVGPPALVLGAGVCLAVVGIELWLLTEALGRMFADVDLSGIERPE